MAVALARNGVTFLTSDTVCRRRRRRPSPPLPLSPPPATPRNQPRSLSPVTVLVLDVLPLRCPTRSPRRNHRPI